MAHNLQFTPTDSEFTIPPKKSGENRLRNFANRKIVCNFAPLKAKSITQVTKTSNIKK